MFMNLLVPNILKSLFKVWVLQPVIFKPENIGLRNRCPNHNETRDVVRNRPSQRNSHSVWIIDSPGFIGKIPNQAFPREEHSAYCSK